LRASGRDDVCKGNLTENAPSNAALDGKLVAKCPIDLQFGCDARFCDKHVAMPGRFLLSRVKTCGKIRQNTGETSVAVTAQNDAFVVFDHVQKSYDGVSLVVKDLNLSIGKGEFLTMLGPSGSGKTTCLMMLAGFETATNGEILLDGRPINQVPPHKRGIGMVFQNYALFPHMTVGENLSFPLEVRGMGKSEREAKVKRALDMVQMYAFINRRPAQLRTGVRSGAGADG
jgi:ABC-type multidrug transport system fused ATPase/permease subunit